MGGVCQSRKSARVEEWFSGNFTSLIAYLKWFGYFGTIDGALASVEHRGIVF